MPQIPFLSGQLKFSIYMSWDKQRCKLVTDVKVISGEDFALQHQLLVSGVQHDD